MITLNELAKIHGVGPKLLTRIAQYIYDRDYELSANLVPPRPFVPNSIVTGDNWGVLASMPSEVVDLTITSPPYDDMRLYSGEYDWTVTGIAAELFRVTKQGGVTVVVIKDQIVNGSHTLTSFELAMIFKNIGWLVHAVMIYGKNNPPPTQFNRYELSFEYMFVFSKGKPKTTNIMTEPTKYAGQKSSSTKRQVDGSIVKFSGHGLYYKATKVKPDIFYYNVGSTLTTQEKWLFEHCPAMLPEQLVIDHILSWSNPGDLVMDIFAGSGSVGKQAVLHGRDYYLIDIDPKACQIMKKRLENL